MIPSGVEAPEWMTNRQALWNAVERSEKRVDAQLYREVEISLPRELSPDQRITLVRKFVKEKFVDHGMVADVAIHCPKAIDGRDQPHAHVMLCMRRIDPTTETGFSTHKERDWNEREDVAKEVAAARKRFNNTGLEADKEALEAISAQRNVSIWRSGWADYANDALAAAGSEARIDHRTLEKQGIFRIPEIVLGMARHVERAYDHLKDRVTHWVGIKKRASLYDEVERMQARGDPQTLMELVLQLGDMAESFAAQFRRPPKDGPEVSHDR